MAQTSQHDIEYVDIRTGSEHHEPTTFYEKWVDQSSAKHATPELTAADALRRTYPGHSLIISNDHRLSSILELPGIVIHAPDTQEARSDHVSSVTFTLGKRNVGELAGSLDDNVIFASHKLTWNKSDFIVHIAKFQLTNCIKTSYFILHDGPEQPARDLMLAGFLYAEQPHDEIWVFNQGRWSKNKTLWLQIKDASWDDIVMKEGSKKALQRDIYGFFKSEATYKQLSIPWKRGLILYGPPGNGKTISIKVIMKSCTKLGFTPLYVKSFRDCQGDEASMQNVFAKARQLAPCVMVLEDLDSLITDGNRSFFLNQLDGLEGNDGLLVIASTNHFDKLDPGLSNRPSRFDRKYLFNDPDHQERVLYAKYWQEKLKDNEEISESLVEEVAALTQGFSFAYLKEAFVSTLVRMTSADDDEPMAFPVVLKNQITTLCKEFGKQIPARLAIPRAQPEKASDERILLARLPSQEDKSAQKSRTSIHLSLPADVSPTEFDRSHDSSLSPTTQSPSDYLPNLPKSRSGVVKVCGIGSTARSSRLVSQGCVMHAPPSAYPQVLAMPGSLPSPGPDRLQDPIASRNGALASTSKLNSGRKNPFSLESLSGEPNNFF